MGTTRKVGNLYSIHPSAFRYVILASFFVYMTECAHVDVARAVNIALQYRNAFRKVRFVMT